MRRRWVPHWRRNEEHAAPIHESVVPSHLPQPRDEDDLEQGASGRAPLPWCTSPWLERTPDLLGSTPSRYTARATTTGGCLALSVTLMSQATGTCRVAVRQSFRRQFSVVVSDVTRSVA